MEKIKEAYIIVLSSNFEDLKSFKTLDGLYLTLPDVISEAKRLNDNYTYDETSNFLIAKVDIDSVVSFHTHLTPY